MQRFYERNSYVFRVVNKYLILIYIYEYTKEVMKMKKLNKILLPGIILFALCLGFIVTERVSADESISISTDSKNRVVGNDIYFDRYIGFNVKCVEQGTVSFDVEDSSVASIGDHPAGVYYFNYRYAIFPGTSIINNTDTTLTVTVTTAAGRIYSRRYNLHKCDIPTSLKAENTQIFTGESILPQIKAVNVTNHFDGIYETLKLNPYLMAYKSSNPNVATVDSTGKVTGIKPGQTIITATYDYVFSTKGYNKQGVLEDIYIYNPSTTYTVNVYDKINRVVFNKPEVTLNKGELFKQNVVNYPLDGETKKEYKWTSSNMDVATVDENGNVTTKNTGKTTITAVTTDGSNESDNYTIYVRADAPSFVNTSYDKGHVKIDWNGVPNALYYEIFRANSPTEEFKSIGTTSGTTYNDADVEYNKTYYYKVASVPTAGSNCESLQTMPTGIRYSMISPKIKSIKVKKKRCTLKISGPKYDNYIVYVGKKKKPKKVYAIITGKKVSFSLKKKGKYYIRVRSLAEESGKKYYSKYSQTKKIKIKKK